ncbi:MAG: DUF134 domain-containing protein, partial [Candidatus Thorarchaeota archaeon]
MPRPKKRRCCRRFDADRIFKPQGIPMRDIETSVLSLDQFEALRLCDYEGMDQETAGARMGISRGTVQRLLYVARKAVVKAILENRAIVVNLRGSEDSHVDMHTDEGRRGARRDRL